MIISAEDFIFHPDTMAFVLESESAADMFRNILTDSIKSKTLTGGYTIVYAKSSEVYKVSSYIEQSTSNVFPIVAGLMDEAALDAAGILNVQRHPFLNLRGTGVLLGFVDTGIDYTQSPFLYEDGSSKIKFIWDQTVMGNPPDGYLYGSEYSQTDINRALSSVHPYEIVPHRDTVGHGTFLASVAGGRDYGEYTGAAPDSEIIMVKLKRARAFDYNTYAIPMTYENAFASADIMLGVQYIADKALELRRPVAICFSLGTSLNAHDGYSAMELFLAKIASNWGTTICAAAGNEGAANRHTHGLLLSTGDTKKINIRAGSKFEDFNVSIWNYASDRISIAVTSPTGEHIGRIPARPGDYSRRLAMERATVTVQYRFPVEAPGNQLSRVKILSATPGVWTVTLYGDIILNGVYHAWLPINGHVDPDTVFLAPTPDSTIVVPGTSPGIITCGAYNIKDNSLSPTTSRGPSRLPLILPDLVAPGVEVGGFFETGAGKMSGTSVSAAITAGASALLLQWGIVDGNDTSLNSYRIRAHLVAGCERAVNNEYPNNQWGYGRLNLFNTFRAMWTI